MERNKNITFLTLSMNVILVLRLKHVDVTWLSNIVNCRFEILLYVKT